MQMILFGLVTATMIILTSEIITMGFLADSDVPSCNNSLQCWSKTVAINIRINGHAIVCENLCPSWLWVESLSKRRNSREVMNITLNYITGI